MNMFRVWFEGYRNTFSCSGRIRRRTYGLFILLHFITVLVLAFALTPVVIKSPDAMQGIAGLVFILLLVLPMLSITIRRGHDCEINGWIMCALSLLFPGIAIGALLVLPPNPGMRQPNGYGPDPRAQDEEDLSGQAENAQA